MNMEGWVLLGADRQEVPVTVYPGQDLVEADLSDIPDVYQDLYWHAPKTYLGDKVSLQLTDEFVHKFVKNFPEWRPDGFCSSGIFLLNPLCFSQVSSYGGYLRYRLYTQTMRGDVLSLPAEASRPDILLKVLDRVLGLTAVKPKCSNNKYSGSSGESDDAGLHGERVLYT